MNETRSGLRSLRFVGPATAAVLADAGVSREDVEEKRVSHDDLVDAGVNPGVAARMRREHSLAWSHATGGDLSQRAERIRGLGDGERAWVAASGTSWEDRDPGDVEPTSPDGGGEAADAEAAWRDRSAPDPVSVLDRVDETDAAALAEAGVTSVRSLSVADADRVADSLDLPVERVREWQAAARDRL